MLKNNLEKIMKEKKLTITDLDNAIPNLSRPTITNLVQNKSKMVRFDTIDILCQFLDITPTEFFSYYKYEYSFDCKINNLETALLEDGNDLVYLTIKSTDIDLFLLEGVTKTTFATLKLKIFSDKNKLLSTSLVPNGHNLLQFSMVADSNNFEKFNLFWTKQIPQEFRLELQNQLLTLITTKIQEYLKSDIGDSKYKLLAPFNAYTQQKVVKIGDDPTLV